MLFGPLFHRELAIAPRRTRLYLARTVYTVLFLILTATAWLILSGSQLVQDTGDMARFGKMLFTILAPLQLVLAMFFAALFSAGNVSQEKDRNTLVLLLMTRMNRAELVLGKLAASMVHLLSNFLATLPIFGMILCFGGVDERQIGQCLGITLATILWSGSLGTVMAFWREQTFQAISMTVLFLVVWLAVGEVLASGWLGESWLGIPISQWAVTCSPWRAILQTTVSGEGASGFPLLATGMSVAVLGWGMLRIRAWNQGEASRREEKPTLAGNVVEETEEEKVRETTLPQSHRPMWNNPILWREMRTRAYGRRAFLVRLAYGAIFLMAALATHQALNDFHLTFYQENREAAGFALQMLLPLSLLSLVLVNAQAVTAITGERDKRAIDLLLVTDLTPKEIVFGKLGGIFYNTREMVVLPLAMIGYFYGRGIFSLEISFYLWGGLLTLFLFSAMLGIHSGMTYAASRSAIGVSLGTLFFLFVGVAVCLRMMLSLSHSFQAQLQPFLAFMVGGGVAMYLALGARNPSSAIGLASFGCPFATFYAISALMMNYTLGVFLVIAVTYGFTTAAMLIPAISEFDIATHSGDESSGG